MVVITYGYSVQVVKDRNFKVSECFYCNYTNSLFVANLRGGCLYDMRGYDGKVRSGGRESMYLQEKASANYLHHQAPID